MTFWQSEQTGGANLLKGLFFMSISTSGALGFPDGTEAEERHF